MKFSLSNRFFFGFQWYFIFLLIIDLLEPTSSAAVPSSKVISLYTANDKVTILTAQNFSSTVYNSKTAWLVEFYASWCGHCQSYANVRFHRIHISSHHKNRSFYFRHIEKWPLIP